MTLREIVECEKEMLTPKDIAPILGCDAYSISLAAKKNPKALGFKVIVVGTRTKIPRRAFLEHLGVNLEYIGQKLTQKEI